MNATEFERELNKLTEDLAEKYIKLRDLERAGYKDEKLMDMLFYGHVARVEARRIQEEFFPMAENSEEIVMTLLNENFVYEEVDICNNNIDNLQNNYNHAKNNIKLPFEHEDELNDSLIRQRELERELDLSANKSNSEDMEM